MRCRRPASIVVLLAAALALFSCATVPRAGVDGIRRIDVYPDNLPQNLDGYRLAFVSDIHFRNNFSAERLGRLVDAINAESPACVVLGGDFTLGAGEIREFARLTGRLAAPGGVYAVSGNHDFYNGQAATCAALRAQGIVVLDESAVRLPGGITLAGINDFRDIYPDTDRLKSFIKDGSAFTILACHDPDYAEETDISDFDLILCGHTHGGQITLFGWAPVLPSAYGQKYRTGTIMKDGSEVIVSNGAGYGGNLLRFRLFAPSDFLLITLHASDPKKDR
jgi:uncharacterized protein